MSGEPTTSDKWFAAVISVLLSLAGLLGVAILVALEGAIWSAGFGNFLFWHTIFIVSSAIAYKFVYKRVLRSLP